MKNEKHHQFTLEKAGDTLAIFGKAQLIRKFDGKHELVADLANRPLHANGVCCSAPAVVFSDASRHEFVLSA